MTVAAGSGEVLRLSAKAKATHWLLTEHLLLLLRLNWLTLRSRCLLHDSSLPSGLIRVHELAVLLPALHGVAARFVDFTLRRLAHGLSLSNAALHRSSLCEARLRLLRELGLLLLAHALNWLLSREAVWLAARHTLWHLSLLWHDSGHLCHARSSGVRMHVAALVRLVREPAAATRQERTRRVFVWCLSSAATTVVAASASTLASATAPAVVLTGSATSSTAAAASRRSSSSLHLGLRTKATHHLWLLAKAAAHWLLWLHSIRFVNDKMMSSILD